MRFLLPEGGVSLLDAPGQPFWDPDADAALFTTIEERVEQTDDRRVERVPATSTMREFAAAAMRAFDEVDRAR